MKKGKEVVLKITVAAFERAYDQWREALVDVDYQGLPWVPGSADSLLQLLHDMERKDAL